ncbi:MAG: hypothetical protein RJA25_2405 [Bacteroidota bacterium]|jgi:hypothetical protein
MKKIIFIAIAIFSITFISCKKEETKQPNETEGLTLVQKMMNDSNEVEIYTKSGSLLVGYNDIFIRIKDKLTDTYKTDAVIGWMPIMHMTSMAHSGPKSTIEKVNGKTSLYKGYVVFTMPGSDMEKWTLSLNFQSGGVASSVTDTVAVANSTKKRIITFTGTDSKKYILALAAPEAPLMGTNDLVVGLFVKENMMSFPAVTDANISMDPRMPDMDNHSSPNNVNPVFNVSDNLYHGKVTLSMTGYWVLNFIVKDASNTVLKGEETPPSPSPGKSSVYLEIEF